MTSVSAGNIIMTPKVSYINEMEVGTYRMYDNFLHCSSLYFFFFLNQEKVGHALMFLIALQCYYHKLNKGNFGMSILRDL